MKVLKKNFGEKLQRLRKLRGYKTQGALAVELGLNQSVVSKWEAGRFTPDDKIVPELCKLLGVNEDYFTAEGGPDSESIFEYVKGLEDQAIALRNEIEELKAHPVLSAYEKVKSDSVREKILLMLGIDSSQSEISRNRKTR